MAKLKNLKFGLLSILATLALLMAGTSAKASHYGAVDLKVIYIGTGPNDLTYEVTLTTYKACDNVIGASLPFNETVTWSSANLSYNSSFSFPMTQGPDTLDQLCPGLNVQNMCRDLNSIYPGFIRHTYTHTVTLPARASDWIFEWSSCCRNGAILNLCQPASSHSMNIVATINNLARFDISTPQFTTPPIPYFCASTPPQVVQFQNGVIITNLADSVFVQPAYALGNGLIGQCGTPIPGVPDGIGFDVGYTFAQPIASATPYYVQPSTGSAFFAPNQVGKYVLAFEAQQLDKGTKTILSSTRRDVQVAVLACASQQPNIDTVPTNLTGANFQNGKIRVCAGQELKFDVTAASQSTTNKVNLYCNNLVNTPGATFSVTGQGSSTAVGTYAWTPNFSFAGNTYLVTFEAVDSTCDISQPLMLRSYFNVLIEVVDVMDAGPDIYNYCSNSDGGVQLFALSVPNANYKWTRADGQPFAPGEIDNPSIQFPRVYPKVTTAYAVTTDSLPANACKNSDTVVVNIDTENPVTILPDLLPIVQCRPGYLQLDASVAGGKPRDNYACGPTTAPSGASTVSTLGNGSAYSQVYSPFFGGNANSAKTQILLRRAELFAAGMRSTTLTKMFLNFSTGNVNYDNIKISLKCTKANEISLAGGGFHTTGLVEVYNNPGTTNITTGWNEFAFTTPYNWDTAQNLVVEICYNNLTPVSTGPEIVYTYANFNTMLRTTSLTTDACALQGGTTTPQSSMFRPYLRFEHVMAPEVDFTYTWHPGNQLSDSTIKNPVMYVNKSTTVGVTIIGKNGCPFSDTATIFMPVHDYELYPSDTSVCEKEKVPYRFTGIGGDAKFQWYQNNFDPPVTIDTPTKMNAIASPPVGNTIYHVAITDSVGCIDTLTARVNVRPFPIINILNKDTTIRYGSSIQLLASGGYLYQWYPAGTLNNPIIPNPIATPLENTTYYVNAIGTNGCANTDSVKIKLNYRDDLFVPSAFSPNGDGKNDVFRVFNITFQKLIEFRIFNRYGQQIFSTINVEDGWDGRWKGIPQDIGTYYYLIRVAYPDGYEETYKGDVTLVR